MYWQFLRAVLSGTIKPGQVLHQEWLAEQFGVSRTPLREALMRLAAEGVIRIEANRGARVTELNFGDPEHPWRARLILEPGAARLAASVRKPEAIARMKHAIEWQRESIGSVEQSLMANREFHLALVQGSDNPYLIRFSEILWAFQVAAPIFGKQVHNPEDVARWVVEHEEILAAVEAGEAERAEELTRRHISAYPPRG